jgi:putative ABC transport system substrate-binding protein
VRRREFLGLLGVAGTWSLSASAQQQAVIGFLSSISRDEQANRVRAFHKGLNEAGYVEGRDVAIEYRWADNKSELLIYRFARHQS